MKYKTPKIPFVEAKHKGGRQKPTAIEIQASFTTSEKGAALGVAQAWHRDASTLPVSHYSVDEVEKYHCVLDNVQAGRKEQREKNVLRVTICAEPQGRQHFWDHDIHDLVLSNAANLVAQLCLAYHIPTKYLDEDATARWKRLRWRRRGGIIVDVPGDWPYRSFLLEVQSTQVAKALF